MSPFDYIMIALYYGTDSPGLDAFFSTLWKPLKALPADMAHPGSRTHLAPLRELKECLVPS